MATFAVFSAPGMPRSYFWFSLNFAADVCVYCGLKRQMMDEFTQADLIHTVKPKPQV